jgi:hypothetical protein
LYRVPASGAGGAISDAKAEWARSTDSGRSHDLIKPPWFDDLRMSLKAIDHRGPHDIDRH